jgi:hypothetical protein
VRIQRILSTVAILSCLAGLGAVATPAATATAATTVPRPDHTVVVIMENHSYSDIIGDTTDAPYLNSLAAQGANFTNSFAVTHPSQPNYLALFSGSTQGLTSDSCPHTFTGGSLGAEAASAGIGFSGYSESMPSQGYTGCTSGEYARKHNPWSNFSAIPTADNKTFAQFPSDYTTLPALSFVVPNLIDDMHDGTIAQGDSWLSSNIDAYAQWAKTHNSLLVVTWDEDDYSESNQVPTIFVGAGVKAGNYDEQINHYSVLRTVEDAYGLGRLGSSATATPITDIWSTSGGSGSVTLSAPANQSGTVGTAASLQISATDTAGGTLSYSATGLPAGLSVNSSTGLISGTPTASGTSSVTVTATDSTGPSASAGFTWTVSAGSSGCTAAQLLGNAGFETGALSPWTGTSGVVSNSTSEPARSGSWDAWLDGYGSSNTDTLAQAVTLPAGCSSYTLSFWLHVDTAETGTTAYDTLKAQVLSSSGAVLGTLATYSNVNAGSGYTQYSYDLSSYQGQSVTVKFTGTEDSQLQTSFVLDDTALSIS